MLMPPIARNRANSFNKVIELLNITKSPNIVEIGTTRQRGNWEGDGYSTIIFGYLATLTSGQLISVDIDPNNARISSEILKEYDIPLDNIQLMTNDGLKFAKSYFDHIDLLYLDAWDYDSKNPFVSVENHSLCFEYFYTNRCIDDNTLILIDDIHDNKTFVGKGQKLIPKMIDLGFEFIINEYQVLMKL